MAKPSDYWQTVNLKAVDFNGLINEDVMQKIFDISSIPLPFTDLVGADTASNPLTEWTTDKLGDPAIGGWVVEGSDIDQFDSKAGKRLGNVCGILVKEVQVSTRASATDNIGRANELAYQVMMRQKELRRNVEANLLGIQGSQADDGNVIPGRPAGLAAMVTRTPGLSTGTGGVYTSSGVWSPWTPMSTGTGQGLTETLVRDACQAAWVSGGDPTTLMAVPGQIRKLSEYMFSSSARIATLQRESGGEKAQALGTVNVFITDFGVTMDFLPNRLQQTYNGGAGGTTKLGSVFILDPAYARVSYLSGYVTEALAKTGLTDKRLMSVDFTLKVLNPDAHRVIPDCNPTTNVVQ